MNKFISVWAPKAKEVKICFEKKELLMQADENDYWKLDVSPHISPQKRFKYAFKVDGKGPYPDPRSKFQPDGVHGYSQLYDDQFSWTDQNWEQPLLKNAIMYELHVGTFSEEGTFAGIETKLDHLKNLGVTHIELLPVAAFPGKHGWGYDGVDLFAPHAHYGSPDDLKHLVNACHAKSIAIILDVVYNHLGPDGNYLGLFGEYFSDRYGTPWGEAVNFDSSHSDQVREFAISNALMWLRDYHFDGLRLDAIHAIYDFSATHILEEMQNRVNELEKETGRKYFLIAESDLNDPQIINNPKEGGYGLAAQWLDDFHHALHKMLTNENARYYADYSGAADLNKCMNKAYIYDGCYSKSRKRKHGRPLNKIRTEQFVVFTQNHDQIGNRALGERLCHLTSFESAQAAAALMMLSPFVPMLFQGEEWAATSPFLYFTDHIDPKLGEAIKKGRKRECAFKSASVSVNEIPDPQALSTFERSCLKWNEIDQNQHKAMLDWYRKLIKLRRKKSRHIFSKKREFKIVDAKKKLYSYQCGEILLILNLGKSRARFNIDAKNTRILLSNTECKTHEQAIETTSGTVLLIAI